MTVTKPLYAKLQNEMNDGLEMWTSDAIIELIEEPGLKYLELKSLAWLSTYENIESQLNQKLWLNKQFSFNCQLFDLFGRVWLNIVFEEVS